MKADKKINIVMLDITEIAEALGVSTRTVYDYLRQGKIKGRKIGHKWQATKEAVEDFLKGK